MKKKTLRVKVGFRGITYIGVIPYGVLTEGLKTEEGNTVPGLHDFEGYISEEDNVDEFIKRFKDVYPQFDVEVMKCFEKPITIKGMGYSGSPFAEHQHLATCHNLEQVKEAVEKLQKEYPEAKNVKVFGGSHDYDEYLNGIFTVSQIVKYASKFKEEA